MAARFNLLVIISMIVIFPHLVLSIVIPLENTMQENRIEDLEHLVRRDMSRHAALLDDKVNFPIEGSFYSGKYLMRVELGTPSTAYSLAVDTASDVLWVNDKGCTNCPTLHQSGAPINFFDLAGSATGSRLSCEDKLCPHCSIHNHCVDRETYLDGTGASGYYVKDQLFLNVEANSSVPIAFESMTSRNRRMKNVYDGVIGFGYGKLSVVSQLGAMGMTPKVFFHCFHGDGGGSLVIGEAASEPSIIYSPLMKSKPHYYLKIQDILINGQVLPVDDGSIFSSNSYIRDTIIDTGSTLAYLVGEAYDALVHVVNVAASGIVTPVVLTGKHCYQGFDSSMSHIFPQVSISFKGGAVLELNPQDYIVYVAVDVNATLPCIGFMRAFEDINIIGVLALRDKIVVYDNEEHSIGISRYYNCSLPVQTKPTPVASASTSPIPEMHFMVLNSLCVILLLLMHY